MILYSVFVLLLLLLFIHFILAKIRFWPNMKKKDLQHEQHGFALLNEPKQIKCEIFTLICIESNQLIVTLMR